MTAWSIAARCRRSEPLSGRPLLQKDVERLRPDDVLIVNINPLYRPEVPKSGPDIQNRINEISFNSSLMREMRAIAFVTKLIDDDQVKSNALKRILIHAIEADEFMRELSVSSKLNPDWEFLTHLHDVGRESAEQWIGENFDRLNVESSIDIAQHYL